MSTDSKFNQQTNRNLWARALRLGIVVLLLLAIVLIGVLEMHDIASAIAPIPSAAPVGMQTAAIRRVTCLGRLEPFGQVVAVGVPASQRYERISKLLVDEDCQLGPGQTIAVMESEPRLRAALIQASCRVAIAQAKLAQVKAGAKAGEISAQQARVERAKEELAGRLVEQQRIIERLQSEEKFAGNDYRRYKSLLDQGAVAYALVDSKRTDWEASVARLQEALAGQSHLRETLQSGVTEELATLNKVSEVRYVDVGLATAELNEAKAAHDRARVELNQAIVAAPRAGTVLKVLSRAGEVPGERGIIEVGDTGKMVAVAEVYENDVRFVHAGQTATVCGASFAGSLKGKVYLIGLKVNRQAVFSNEPGVNFDNRIVEIKILLDRRSSKIVGGLTNSQVQVEFLGQS
jgi:HlyD family secretion protein